MTRSAGRPRADVQQEAPTDKERAAGDVFYCAGCERDWPLRYKHAREILCLSCGRAIVRQRKQAQRARARGELAPTPPTPRQTKTEAVAGEPVEIDDFVQHAQPEMLSEIDRIVQQATRKKPKKPGTGMMYRAMESEEQRGTGVVKR